MKRLLLFLFVLVFGSAVHAQDHKWALGFYGDMQLESPSYFGSFGIQGKYDFSLHHGVQMLVNGRKDYAAVGVDYIFNFMDKTESNFNIFAGAGFSQDFYRREVISSDGDEDGYRPEYERFSVLNAQVGVSYYVPDVALSVYAGYKLKADIDFDNVQPNYLMIGLRYHLW